MVPVYMDMHVVISFSSYEIDFVEINVSSLNDFILFQSTRCYRGSLLVEKNSTVYDNYLLFPRVFIIQRHLLDSQNIKLYKNIQNALSTLYTLYQVSSKFVQILLVTYQYIKIVIHFYSFPLFFDMHVQSICKNLYFIPCLFGIILRKKSELKSQRVQENVSLLNILIRLRLTKYFENIHVN